MQVRVAMVSSGPMLIWYASGLCRRAREDVSGRMNKCLSDERDNDRRKNPRPGVDRVLNVAMINCTREAGREKERRVLLEVMMILVKPERVLRTRRDAANRGVGKRSTPNTTNTLVM